MDLFKRIAVEQHMDATDLRHGRPQSDSSYSLSSSGELRTPSDLRISSDDIVPRDLLYSSFDELPVANTLF